MPHTPHREPRKSPRLKGYDYTQEGAYFVTICTHRREHLFGAVTDGEMRCNAFGDIVWACWEAIPAHFPHVEIDAFIVMLNHVHGILLILDRPDTIKTTADADPNVGLRHASTLPANQHKRGHGFKSGSLNAIVASFKSAATKQINHLRATPGAPVWQRSFHDHIIRHERQLNTLREYTIYNAAKWAEDRYFAE